MKESEYLLNRISRSMDLLDGALRASQIADPEAADRQLELIAFELENAMAGADAVNELRRALRNERGSLMTQEARDRLISFRKRRFLGIANPLFDGNRAVTLTASMPDGIVIEYLKGNIAISSQGELLGVLDIGRFCHDLSPYVTQEFFIRYAIDSYVQKIPHDDDDRMRRYLREETDAEKGIMKEYARVTHGFRVGIDSYRLLETFARYRKTYMGDFSILHAEVLHEMNVMMASYARDNGTCLDGKTVSQKLIRLIDKASRELDL